MFINYMGWDALTKFNKNSLWQIMQLPNVSIYSYMLYYPWWHIVNNGLIWFLWFQTVETNPLLVFMLCVSEGDPHINKLFIICVFLRFNKHNLDYITKGFSGVTLCISSCVGWVGCHQLSSLFQLSDSLPQSELLIILLILQQLMHPGACFLHGPSQKPLI